MTEYGLACFATILLCMGDRIAMRWAVLLGCMWLCTLFPHHIDNTLNGYWAYPLIDIAGMGAMIVIGRQYAAYAGTIFALTCLSVLAWVLWIVCYFLHINVSPIYGVVTNGLFAASLAIVAVHGGGKTLQVVSKLIAWILERKSWPRASQYEVWGQSWRIAT